MPHKVNPIDFENAEGNFGLANALLTHMSAEAAGEPLAARPDRLDGAAQHGRRARLRAARLRQPARGLAKLEVNEARWRRPRCAWEVLAEPIQTVMRRYGAANPYERLKELTRGKAITREAIAAFIDTLREVPAAERERLKAMTPATYTGLAAPLAARFDRRG
jgi:adenylosuccinate lyase